jgi:hypothetical protein
MGATPADAACCRAWRRSAASRRCPRSRCARVRKRVPNTTLAREQAHAGSAAPARCCCALPLRVRWVTRLLRARARAARHAARGRWAVHARGWALNARCARSLAHRSGRAARSRRSWWAPTRTTWRRWPRSMREHAGRTVALRGRARCGWLRIRGARGRGPDTRCAAAVYTTRTVPASCAAAAWRRGARACARHLGLAKETEPNRNHSLPHARLSKIPCARAALAPHESCCCAQLRRRCRGRRARACARLRSRRLASAAPPAMEAPAAAAAPLAAAPAAEEAAVLARPTAAVHAALACPLCKARSASAAARAARRARPHAAASRANRREPCSAAPRVWRGCAAHALALNPRCLFCAFVRRMCCALLTWRRSACTPVRSHSHACVVAARVRR